MRTALLTLPLVVGCASDPGPAEWAVDPIWLDATDTDGIEGVHTWELFGGRWDNGFKQRHYVCGVVVALSGTPVACDDCQAWDIETAWIESDCDDVERERYLSLRGLSLRRATGAEDAQAPWPGQSVWVEADYGQGLQPYGWGWPAALDQGRASTSDGTFDGSEPFQLRPTQLWDLTL